MNNIENKVIVITGASSGLGEATARLLAKKVQRLYLVLDVLKNYRLLFTTFVLKVVKLNLLVWI